MQTTRILIAVVDDEESVRRALGRLIRSAGMDADEYSCGAGFLQGIESRRPDCVVLDLHMPGLNGFDVQARLRQMPPLLPVVAITGHDSLEAAARVMGEGAAAYLLKPVQQQTLLDAIARAVGIARFALRE